jgi:hypothetical protein
MARAGILDILRRQKSAMGSESVAGIVDEGSNLMLADDEIGLLAIYLKQARSEILGMEEDFSISDYM